MVNHSADPRRILEILLEKAQRDPLLAAQIDAATWQAVAERWAEAAEEGDDGSGD